MEYMTTKEAAEKWGITVRQVQYNCENRSVESAIRTGHMWLIHKDAPKPIDGRTKAAKQIKQQPHNGGTRLMNDKYELRLYDTTLLSFTLTSNPAIGYSADLI